MSSNQACMENFSIYVSPEHATSFNYTRVGWVPSPPGRGTLSILLSCLTTLFLCSWSAVHLNIPGQDESSSRYLWRYCKWCVAAVTGPELVLWMAWRQYISAKTLVQESKQSCHWKSSNPDRSETSVWTLTHGFYAGMGGFVIDLDTAELRDKPRFIPDCRRLTITPKGIELLAKCGVLPEISKDEILDKSKSDGLGKSVACLQATWMLLQICSRLYLDLPVTPLEVNTVGHVLCAISLYCIWWNKPRWIKQPTRLTGPELRPLCAIMYMCSHMSSCADGKLGIMQDLSTQSEIASLLYHTPCDEHNSSDSQRSELNGSYSTSISQSIDDMLSSERYGSFKHALRATGQDIEMRELEGPASGPLDATTAERWKLAALAICSYPAIKALMKPARSQLDGNYENAVQNYPEMPDRAKRRMKKESATRDMCPAENAALMCNGEQFVCARSQDWPSEDLFRRSQGLILGSLLWFATVGYSSIHIAAWYCAFPSTAETWIWRASSAWIGFSGVVWLFIHILAQFSGRLWWFWYDVLAGSASKVSYLALGTICGVCGVLYLFARSFIVIEAFASLRLLPSAAFISPQWTLSIPHL